MLFFHFLLSVFNSWNKIYKFLHLKNLEIISLQYIQYYPLKYGKNPCYNILYYYDIIYNIILYYYNIIYNIYYIINNITYYIIYLGKCIIKIPLIVFFECIEGETNRINKAYFFLSLFWAWNKTKEVLIIDSRDNFLTRNI